jgi:SAM-dependent methyltransferase
MWFQPYAADLASRLKADRNTKVLEIAAGTGILTEELLRVLPAGAKLVSTDLNPPMLEIAQARIRGNIEWRVADALNLPFSGEAFDAVVCQFGVMFFPDRVKGYREIKRVLRNNGKYLFNVWGSLEENYVPGKIATIVRAQFPKDPPNLFNLIYGYFQRDAIASDLRAGGFEVFDIEEVKFHTGTFWAEQIAVGVTQGLTLANFFESNQVDGRAVAFEIERGLIQEFGSDRIPMDLKAWVIQAQRKD